MKVVLSPGDMLIIEFAETDSESKTTKRTKDAPWAEFRVHFDSGIFPNALVVEETANLPDTTGRTCELYRENFFVPYPNG